MEVKIVTVFYREMRQTKCLEILFIKNTLRKIHVKLN